MWSGSSLHEECIFPFGMLCLSAWIMMFVKMVFAVCMSGGGIMDMLLFRVPARMVVRRPAPINQLFNDESIAVQI